MHVRAAGSSAAWTHLLCLFLLTLSWAPALTAQEYRYSDSWAEAGMTLTGSTSSAVEITFSVTQWALTDIDIDGEALQNVMVPGMLLPNDEGAPNLPGLGRYLALPNDAVASFRVTDVRTETLTDVDLVPAPRIPLETEDGPLIYHKDMAIYSRDAFYPENPVLLSPVTEIRGVDAVLLGITPFQYNPITRELIVYRDLTVEVTFSGGDGRIGEERLRSRWWDPILADLFLNAEALPAADYDRRSNSRTEDFEYLIICPDDPLFTAWADSLRIFRTEQGIRTGVVTVTEIGGNSVSAIESYIDNAYTNWDIPPAAVLLLGDYGTGSNGIISPIWDSYCLSDNIFADVNNDNLPDIIFARITAQNEQHLQTIVGKGLAYERQPPTNPGFYQNPIMAGGWQTSRWFILCEEVLAGYLTNVLGKTPVREYAIYDGTPGSVWSTATNTGTVVSYFGPTGLGYIPSNPSYLTDWGGNATRINNDVNAGAFILQHRDHGGNDGWGEPDYDTGDLAGLYNTDLTFVFSINCLTGEFNIPGQCFAEAFHHHAQGALGIIAASETSYSFVNDAYVWGMYDYFWPDFDPGYGADSAHDMRPAFANAYGKYYLQASSWPYNPAQKTVTYHLFHHHGDAFMNVYTEVPELLTVSHDGALLSGVGFFFVTADEGAQIGLSVNGDFLGTAVGTGNPLTIDIPPQMPGADLVVTVTKQNFYRYRQAIPIIPPEGSYVVYNSFAINDANGNDNGALDYGEQVLLSLSLHNVGLQTALDVTATIATDDEYVTILDDTADFGDIAADSTAIAIDGYELAVDLAVPDGNVIPFTVTVTDADSSYVSYFDITANAPDLVVANYVIEDGDDNILDPGETADLVITLHNSGGAVVSGLVVALTSQNPNVQVLTNDFRIPVLPPDGSRAASFQLAASDTAQIGELAEFLLDVVGPDYEFHTSFGLSIGLSIEDFESGYFVSYPWFMSGDANWSMDSLNPYEGLYCARSGDVGDDESSVLSCSLEVLAPGEISFWYKVSSESGWDYLRFKIDGGEVDSWSGTVGWSQGTYLVTAGTHTFTWSYSKDGSVTSGEDCGWIDYIVFPAVGEPPMPSVTITPADFTVTLAPSDTTTRQIVLENVGEGELHFSVTIAASRREPSSSETFNFKKDEPDPRQGVPPVEGAGGPDEFGYTWIDSDEPGGPVYEWVEINGVGTVAGSGDDANHGPFDLGFDFLFYGIPFNQVRVCTNGWISFTSTSTSYSNVSIPGTSAPNNLVAPFWDDLNPNSGGTIYYYADSENQRFIVEWDGVPHYSSGGPETFQVILDANGTIVYQYKTVDNGISCSVGIENADGDDGLQVVFNAGYLHNDLAILLEADEPWLSVTPMSGSVDPFGSGTLAVLFNSADVEIGEYNSVITIHCNDPDNPVVTIPVTLYVEVTSDVTDASPLTFALGQAYPNPFNPSTTIEFAMPRAGRARLHIYDLSGRLVRSLVDDDMEAGTHAVTWQGLDGHGRQVASGIYYYRLQAGDFSETRKMMLLK